MNRIITALALLLFLAPATAQDGINNPQTNASQLTTGTLPAARLPAFTGDVTTSVGTSATTLAAGSASNLNSGVLAAARGGAGSITGALKGNGSGTVSQAACADVSNGAAGCSATLATQAEEVTGSTTTAFTSPGRQQFHPSAAKAWVAFAGASGTTAVSYNVTGNATRNAVGDYTVTITTGFSTANFACTPSGSASASVGTGGQFAYNILSATSVNVKTFNTAGVATDPTAVSLVCWGTQ